MKKSSMLCFLVSIVVLWMPGSYASQPLEDFLNQPHENQDSVFSSPKIEELKHKKGLVAWQTYKWLKLTEQVTRPRTIGILAAGALGIFGAWHGTSLVRDLLNYWLVIPPLAQETSIRSWRDKLMDSFVPRTKKAVTLKDVIFKRALMQYAEKLSLSIKNTALNDTFFRHYLFYGPPGTGKTLLAMALAHEAGLEYIYFSAAKLEQYSCKEGVRQLTHLFEYAKCYPKKLMILMDEGDVLFKKRDTCSEKIHTFLNLILTYTGTKSRDFMLVVMTNREEDLDDAAVSRFGVKLRIGPPGLEERAALFRHSAFMYFAEAHKVQPDSRTLFQKLFTAPPKKRIPLSVASDVWTSQVMNDLASKSEGLVGRDIDDLMLSVQCTAYGTQDHMVTKDMIFSELSLKIAQNKALEISASDKHIVQTTA